jgi:hypothetical protein
LSPTSRVRSSSAIGFPFPMRTRSGIALPNAGSPKCRRDPFVRDLLFDSGRADMASLSGSCPCCVRLSARSPLLRRTHYGAQSHTPRNRCVCFVADVTVGSPNTRFQAACWALLGSDRLIAPALLGAFAEVGHKWSFTHPNRGGGAGDARVRAQPMRRLASVQ